VSGSSTAVDRLARHPFHPGVALSVHGADGEWHLAAGNLTPDTPVYLASATKLMLATVVHQMAAEGLDLDAPLRPGCRWRGFWRSGAATGPVRLPSGCR
jgi:CubicO group peptidase (beta-lactamase class C family)